MDITQERKLFHNTEAQMSQSLPHVHKFEPKPFTDPSNDDVEYIGQCWCGEREE